MVIHKPGPVTSVKADYTKNKLRCTIKIQILRLQPQRFQSSKYIYFYFQSSLERPVGSHVGKHWPKQYHPNSFTSRFKFIIFWLLSTSLTSLSGTPSPYASFRPPSLSLCYVLYQEGTSPTEWSGESIPPSMSCP